MNQQKGFYKNFFNIYVALVLQNIITISVNLADNVMLGAYSETALSGAAAVNQIQFVYQQLLLALGDGLVIFCSQYWGKKQTGPMKKIAAIAMYAAIFIAVVLFVLVSFFPYQAVGIFTTDGPIIEAGVSYLNVIRFTYLFFAITQILLATMRSVETVKIAFQLSVMTFFVNCGINYVLIFGHFGAPELGIVGAAIGTLTARIMEIIVLIFYIKKKDKKLQIRLSDYFSLDKQLAKDYTKITAPMVFTQGLWGVNTALQTAILGHMTATAIAANSAASTLFLLMKSTVVGAASTASIIIGKAIGVGDIEQVKSYAKRLQRLFIVIGVCSGIALFFLRVPFLSLYDLKQETMMMTNTFLIILSVVYVGMSYQMPTNNGIIRGGGNTMFVVKMDLISIWGIVIPLSLFMAFVVKASPAVVVCCLNADQIFKCVPAFLESHYGNWIRKLTRDDA
ncbi:MATE family efflux transporter [Ruminococcus hominis]|uniref:Probable multidrug resistance protein NorM n=1 Tax=Ruminococcus hominis TaxID=2763065 RepID=A0ABR7G8Y7_9FIRM|nr:MATE family efflux transporter [Ruminococcus hominis]MBC5683902.1 MATE family efflux transporter [Ruminococcus hominis]